MTPLFVELCAGTAALSLRLQGGRYARPPVSRMGSKQGYASAILRCLGLRSGSGAERYLFCEPDPGCRLLLHSYTDAELRRSAAEIIQGWKDEDPRKLWQRLKNEGPVKGPEVDPREVARWIRIVTANRLINLGPDFRNTGQGGSTHGGDAFCTPVSGLFDALLSTPSLPASILPDARAVDPREVARWCWVAGHGSMDGRLAAQYLHPEGNESGQWKAPPRDWLCRRLSTLPTLPASILPDARAVDPPQLPPGCVVYIDPPYQNTTGYQHKLSRAAVCDLAERWASAGAWVVISEAEPLTELDGWHEVEITGERIGQARTFSRQKREFLTLSRPAKWRPSTQRRLWGAA